MAKKIMIQGTMSNAGKSLLTAGLLRVFAKDGYRAAPFKSQNMALNSYITKEGLEIGRAQAMQAEAAGIEPCADMNPILLKPNSDMGSQIILRGEVLGNMKAADYFAYKKKLVPDILEAFHNLEEQYDILVIEGAGSPAEINLREDDIVNMGLAGLVDAPVLLAGDIDRGGVFAQLYGTVELLREEERRRIKGLIINKFRGDRSILEPGVKQIEALCRIPVLGVMPYISVDIEDEDSLSERFSHKTSAGAVNVSVVKLPHISNFTDFDALEADGQLNFSYAEKPYMLEKAELIILPGTKNTMDDLVWLRENGFAPYMERKVAEGCVLVGICGGYQMLGEYLSDPCHTEHGGDMKGLGYLPVKTVFREEKTRTRVQGRILEQSGFFGQLSGKCVSGYEIHMGETDICRDETEVRRKLSNSFSVIQDQNGRTRTDGAVCGKMFGTYLHGIFEEEEFRTAFLELVFAANGKTYGKAEGLSGKSYKEQQFDILEAAVRENLDLNRIYEILEQRS